MKDLSSAFKLCAKVATLLVSIRVIKSAGIRMGIILYIFERVDLRLTTTNSFDHSRMR
jgi:hypothetical protein